jgi:uncharacterized RDD family membrane protein YckC
MQLFIARDGKQTGPFSEEQVRAMLADGSAVAGDLCWQEGQPAWLAISEVLHLPVAAPPPIPPVSTQRNALVPQVGQHPGFLLRFAGYIIDTVVIQVLLYPVGLILGIAMAGSGELEQETTIIVGTLLSMGVGWLYYAAMESSTKQGTVGAIALGFFVTDLEGKRISFGKASGRYFGMILSFLILCIGFMMCAWTERRQCLHDILAGCLMYRR